MKYLKPEEEILTSWRRCMKIGLSSSLSHSIVQLSQEQKRIIIHENDILINMFEDSIEEIKQFLSREFFFV